MSPQQEPNIRELTLSVDLSIAALPQTPSTTHPNNAIATSGAVQSKPDLSYWNVTMRRMSNLLVVGIRWFPGQTAEGIEEFRRMYVIPRMNRGAFTFVPIRNGALLAEHTIQAMICENKVRGETKFIFDIVLSTIDVTIGPVLTPSLNCHNPAFMLSLLQNQDASNVDLILKVPTEQYSSFAMVSANREILSRHRVWKTMIDSSVRRRTATIYMRERFPPNETFHVRSVVRSGNRMIPATMEIAKDANGANNSVSDVEMELVKGGDDLVGSCLDLLSRLAFTSAPIAPAPTAAAPVTAAGTGTDLLTRYNGKYGFNRVNLEAHKDCSLQALCTVLWYMYTGGIHRRVDPADFIITTFDLRTSPVLPQTQRPQGQTSQWYDIRRWDSRTRYRFECPEVLWPDLLIAASWFGLEDLKAYCEKKVLMTLDGDNVGDILFKFGSASEKVKEGALEYLKEHIPEFTAWACDPLREYAKHPEYWKVVDEVWRRWGAEQEKEKVKDELEEDELEKKMEEGDDLYS